MTLPGLLLMLMLFVDTYNTQTIIMVIPPTLFIVLNYSYIHKGVEILCCDMFGEGSGPIHIHAVTCVGSETSITDCTYMTNTFISSHQQDVGVQCQQG